MSIDSLELPHSLHILHTYKIFILLNMKIEVEMKSANSEAEDDGQHKIDSKMRIDWWKDPSRRSEILAKRRERKKKKKEKIHAAKLEKRTEARAKYRAKRRARAVSRATSVGIQINKKKDSKNNRKRKKRQPNNEVSKSNKVLKMVERELKVKTGVLKRYLQEVEYYRKEVEKQTEKINLLKNAEDPDQYVIKKANEVQQENHQMLALTIKNVKKANTDLSSLVETNEDGELKKAAQELIQKAAQIES